MNEVKWNCPKCGNCNYDEVNGIEFEVRLIFKAMCDDCREISALTVELMPTVTQVDSKINY